jgi:hypothetical protein
MDLMRIAAVGFDAAARQAFQAARSTINDGPNPNASVALISARAKTKAMGALARTAAEMDRDLLSTAGRARRLDVKV